MAKYRFEQIAINSTEKKKPVEEDRFTYLGLEHLDPGSLKVTRFGSDVAPIGEKLVMRKGDVLFGKRRAYQKKVAIAPFDGIFSAHGMVLRPNAEVIDPDFFPLFISSDYFLDAAINISVGSLSPTINWRDLKILEFELPDLETQRKLAAVLWSINDTMESYKKLISATDELVKSQFMEQFRELIEQPEACSKIEDICTVFADGDWIESKDQSDEGIRLIQTGNIGNDQYLDKGERARFITEDTFERLNCTEVKANDILISRLPDPVGRACIIPEGLGKCITAVDCTIVRLESRVKPEYFIAYTRSPFYMMQVASRETGSTRKRISRKNLGMLTIPVPTIASQERFAALVRQSDKSQFIEMFADTPNGVLSDVATITMGQSPDGKTYNDEGNGTAFYQGKTEFGDLYIGAPTTWTTAPTRFAEANDVLMSVRAPVGSTNIAVEQCCLGRGLAGIRPIEGKSTTMFILYSMRSIEDQIENMGVGSTFKAIKKEQVYKLPIPLADLAQQARFVELAEQSDKSKFVLDICLKNKFYNKSYEEVCYYGYL